MSNEDWADLAEVLEARISELNLTQSEIQSRGGPSPAKVREIINRRATSLSPSKRRDLERAVQWDPGSVDIALQGGTPTKSSQVETAIGKLLRIYAKREQDLTGDELAFMREAADRRSRAQRSLENAPLVDLVLDGQALAASKEDPDVSAYVRRVESAVVGVVGIEQVSAALDSRAWAQTIRHATEAGVLDEYLAEEDRIDEAGITGRDRVRHLSIALEDILARRTLAMNDTGPGESQNDYDLAARKVTDFDKPGRGEDG